MSVGGRATALCAVLALAPVGPPAGLLAIDTVEGIRRRAPARAPEPIRAGRKRKKLEVARG